MAECWMEWGTRHGYFETDKGCSNILRWTRIYDHRTICLLPIHRNGSIPDSSAHMVLKGTGQGHYYVDPQTEKIHVSHSAYERPQPHACFILSVNDDLNLIPEELWISGYEKQWILKYGSGSRFNFSFYPRREWKIKRQRIFFRTYVFPQDRI